MVKCKDCGFLAVRNRNTGEIQEAILPTRKNGCIEGQEVFPECSVKANNIKSECRDQPKNFTSVVSRERDCNRFIGWIEGYSPKEHVEMELLQKVEAQHRRFREEDIEIAERRHRECLDWQETVEDRLERRHKVTIAIQFLLALLAAAVALIAAKTIPWFNF